MMEMKKNLEPEPRVLVQSPRKAKRRRFASSQGSGGSTATLAPE